ncbi:hypothetical protein HK105_203692 [Polyrhizophydium stewartii]|uniref:Uncharacterized protein n=1 Tax=Polyrhizophydium stewartii TaxID=2732419 RepID=A0ABR4NBK5_9FUNG
MYNGFHIFRAHAIEDMRLDHIGEHTMHKSIAYGADWSFDRSSRHNSPRSNIVGTCSFYDHLLTFWVADIHAGDESA